MDDVKCIHEEGQEDVVGEFNKLKETRFILEYQEHFEELTALMLVSN